MMRDDFTKKYWNYYRVLEDECADLCSYVEFDEMNFETYSSKITRMILSICSEFDHVCRYVCEIDKEKPNINDYAKILLDEKKTPILNIRQAYAVTIVNKNLFIFPFEGWSIKCASQSLFWWENYTCLKHNRGINYKKGNLKTLLYAMAALYLLEQYAYKNIAVKEKALGDSFVFDIPPDKSKLFISNIETKAQYGTNLYYEEAL